MPSGRHAKGKPEKSGSLRAWLVSISVAILVAGALWYGTQLAPKPIFPASSNVVQTECKIDTSGVRKTVEDLHKSLNARRRGALSAAQFEKRVADSIPAISDAVKSQEVKCRAVP